MWGNEDHGASWPWWNHAWTSAAVGAGRDRAPAAARSRCATDAPCNKHLKSEGLRLLTLPRGPSEYASTPCESAPTRPKRRMSGCASTRTRHAWSRILSEPVSAPPDFPEALLRSQSPPKPLLQLPHRGHLPAPRPLIAARMESSHSSPNKVGTDKTPSVPSRSCEDLLIALLHSENLRPNSNMTVCAFTSTRQGPFRTKRPLDLSEALQQRHAPPRIFHALCDRKNCPSTRAVELRPDGCPPFRSARFERQTKEKSPH